VAKPDEELPKFDLRSEDIAESRRQELLRIFPEAHTESGGINFEALRLSLGDAVQSGPEMFGMSWPGKAECAKTIQKQSIATLLPVEEESVNWDTTQNVIIEGDNLEVLKVLQKAYLGKVKMIYIDPPYNTSNDFIYPDNFTESLKTYLQYTNQIDNEGKKFSTHTEASGRFHSKWMNMMYSRLALAKSLLSADGVIFVSIDDKEASNLKHVLNDIFGESSYLGTVTWINKSKPVNVGRARMQLQQNCEYVFVYSAAGKEQFQGFVLEKGEPREYPHDGDLGKCRFENIEKTNAGRMRRESMRFPILGHTPREGRRWQFSLEEANRLVNSGRIQIVNGRPVKAVYPQDEASEGERPFWSHLDEEIGTAETGKNELKELVGEVGFDTVKPLGLVEALISHMPADSVVLDFFAGSGTTAHAVMAQNARDGGDRKFILVQLPEQVDPESEGGKVGFRTIFQLTRARVKKAAEAISSNFSPPGTLKLDLGFRCFKLGPSNFAVWDANAIEGDEAKLEQQLFAQVEHVLPGRTNEDILFELMLKSRYELTTPVEKKKVGKCEVWKVAGGEMAAVIDACLTVEVIREIASWKPVSVVILDRCFGADDSLKANARKIFEDSKVDLKTV
jgi:adenine-specific DNA-methyltransferase